VLQVSCVYRFIELLTPHLQAYKNISFPHGFQIQKIEDTVELFYKDFMSKPDKYKLIIFDEF
jgi:hypothetical protein